MGFGVALIGYACLMLHEVGGGVFAAPILAYGFFLASRLNGNFLKAAVSALFLFPRGVLQVCSAFGFINIDELPTLNTVTFLLYLGAWALMSYFWLTAVIQIAHENGAQRLETKARIRLIITVSFLMLSGSAWVLNVTGVLGDLGFMIASAQYIMQYAVIFINIFFLHTCFVMITSEKQYERDKQEIAKERAKALEKRQKEIQEAKRFGKKK